MTKIGEEVADAQTTADWDADVQTMVEAIGLCEMEPVLPEDIDPVYRARGLQLWSCRAHPNSEVSEDDDYCPEIRNIAARALDTAMTLIEDRREAKTFAAANANALGEKELPN